MFVCHCVNVIYSFIEMDAENSVNKCLLINDEVNFAKLFREDIAKINHIEVTEVAKLSEAGKLLFHKKYDLIALNLQLNELNISSLFREIKAAGSIPILLILPSLEYLFIKRHLVSGSAWGFCILNEVQSEVKDAVEYLKKGKRFISREMMELLVEDLLSTESPKKGAEFDPRRFELLDEKEFEIFTHLSRNRKDEVIARIMNIHTSAVGLYRDRIFEKLRIKDMKSLKSLISC